jgi:SAM-dependent methyltransferase
VLIADLRPERYWLYQHGLPTKVHDRLVEAGLNVHWHAQAPGPKSRKLHPSYEPALSHQLLRHLWERGLHQAKQTAKALLRRWQQGNPTRLFQAAVAEERSLAKLLAEARAAGAKRLVLIGDDQVALTVEGVELALRLAEEFQAELLCCTQLDGLLPLVISVAFLSHVLEQEPELTWEKLVAPSGFARHGLVMDVELIDSATSPSPVRCRPIDPREQMLLKFWREHEEELEDALRSGPETPGPSRNPLTRLIQAYRQQLAPALPTYHVVGTLHDVQELRRKMNCSEKPLLDYFVIATHYGRFLREYAGLKPGSRVVDIGCSWGYLAFALANFLGKEGAYIGIEVQKCAAGWTRERLAWLGDNFRFVHLDIQNTFYNPDGTTPRSEVRLPVENAWADVIVAGSVFTHMLEDGVAGYLRELRRILRPQGILAFSYLDSSALWAGEATLSVSKDVPDEITVYSRSRINELVASAGLRPVREPVNMRQFDRTDYQTWCFAGPK